MSTWLEQLANPALLSLKPYESARRLYSGGQDWLNANESPFANDYALDMSRFNRYPSCQPSAVVQGYADYAHVRPTQVMVTRGADEGIELLIRTFCTPGKDKVLICPPTYGMYAISAETCDVGVEKVPLREDFSLNVERICAIDNIKLVFICSPNNPTGTGAARDAVAQVLAHFAGNALVVVDEAYIEFDKDNSWASLLSQYPNLVVLRTLSKAFALAGIRCGFTLANEDVIALLMKVIAPYPIPEPVAQIAAQALSPSGLARMSEQLDYLAQERAALTEALAQRAGITLVGDQLANFVLFRCAYSSELMAFLVSQGMLIRDQSKQLGLQNCLRVSIGKQEQNQRLLSLIDTFIATQEANQ